MTYLAADYGSKGAIHSFGQGEGVPLVRKAVEQGWAWRAYKSVGNLGAAAEVKGISPKTLTIGRLYTPWWDGCDGLEGWSDTDMARRSAEITEFALDHTNEWERRNIDLLEVLNEAAPKGAHAWTQYGKFLTHLVRHTQAAGLRILTPSFNYGCPEWDEIVALVATGFFEALIQARGVLAVHDGSNPFEDAPMSYGPIPGAPNVPGAGPLFWRYRYLTHHLASKRLYVPIIVSETYYGAGYTDLAYMLARYKAYDQEARQDPWIVAHMGFTCDPIAGWSNQDYTPLYTSRDMLAYMASEAGKPNRRWQDIMTNPTPTPPTAGIQMRVDPAKCSALNVRAHPWAGRVTPPYVRTLQAGELVTTYGNYRDHNMAYGWYAITDDGDQWVSGYYLKPV